MSSTPQGRPLAGRGVVVTRPRDQAGELAARIAAAGGTALLYPAMEIDEVEDPAPLRAIIDRLHTFDLAVFVSPTAVQRALALVRERRAWPAQLASAAVGRASRAELERHGIAGALAPSTGADSEALLALPELARVAGKRVVIFRGEGGRELLGDSLCERGASVTYAACYRRSPPRQDIAPLLLAWSQGAVHALTSSSSAGLSNFAALLGGEAGRRLGETPVFVPHTRIAEAARLLGAAKVITCGPGDEEMVEALVAYFRAP